MAFWEEPPIYMTERERRLRFQDPVFPKLEDESIHSNTIIEEKEVKEDSDDERSNFKMKSKEKLHELARYVIDHMFRSMRSKWPKIKEIFLPKGRSNLRRETSSRLGRNSSPPPPLLRQPSITASASNNRNKTPTSAPKARKEVRVPLSAVFASLVSTDLAIPLSDALKVIWGLRLPETDVQLSCRIFIQSIENELFDHIDMNLISQTDEVLVSETQLMNAMFSDDPVLREKELSVAQDDYRMVAAAILEKNRKVYSIEEKGKIRGLKNITLFDTALFEQQPSKGPLHGRRLDVIFRLVIATRKQLHFERIRRANQILATYRTLLELIDRDYFSDTFLAFVKDPPFNAPPTFDGENNAGIPPSSVFHILHLAGSPTLVEGCRTLILAGQGLNGMALSNVAEILQALAASKIQNYFRTHRRKWRYFTARGKWRIVFLAVKKSHVKAWFMYTQQMIRYRTHCLRKIVAWHFYTKKNKTRRYFFQHSYWPFYVWHRYSSASRIAKEKCKFLVTRVYPTYVQLKFFRAWKKVIIERLSWHLKSDLHYRSTLKQKMFQAFGWLRRQSRMKVALRNSDLKKRLRDVTSQILTRKISYFQVTVNIMVEAQVSVF